VFFDEPQKMILRNLIFQAKVVEQRSERECCPIMISTPPTMVIQQNMARIFFFFYHALLPFSLQSQ